MKLLISGKWRVKNAQYDIEATVPGDITADFLHAGIIADPYYDDNYKDSLWITQADWEYVKTFEVNADELDEQTTLIFEGIDTFAEISLNGVSLGEAKNMHRTYSFDVTDVIKNGTNTLTVKMKNVFEALGSNDQDKYCSIFCANRLFIRKAQCHFGWDWAPKFPGYGIYRDVTLVSQKRAAIKELSARGDMHGNACFRLLFGEKFKGRVTVRILDGDKPVSEREVEVFCKKLMLNLKVDEPELWWPNGYGEAKLYSYVIIQTDEAGNEVAKKEGRLAFKSVELDQSPLPNGDNNFAIKINGMRVFAKGSNWVPAECMTGTLSKEKYIALLKRAKDANFNMLRVWGGGIYESPDFYDYCDEAGIMIWQDFAFACSSIPEDIPEFTAEVIAEATEQVKRLGNHACLTLWCGMNEIVGSFDECDEDYSVITLHYILRGIVGQHNPEVPYIRCSPFAFADTENDEAEGDCHRNLSEKCLFGEDFMGFEECEYDESVISDGLYERIRHYERYVTSTYSNFSSECAVLGMCNYESLIKFTPEDKLGNDSKFLEERFLGNPYTYVMPTFFERQHVLAEGMYGKLEGIKDLVKKANKSQANILATEIIYSRTSGRSNGLLNWMYNDIWPTGTWALVDYYLSEKPAYYEVKRCFRPLLAEVTKICDAHCLCCANDTHDGATLDVTVYLKRYDGTVLRSEQISAFVESNGTLVKEIELELEENCYLEAVGTFGSQAVESVFDVSRFTKKTPQNAVYSTKIQKTGDGEYAVTVTAESFVPCVKIHAGEGAEYSDNCFDLGAGRSRTVIIKTRAREEDFTFCTLYDEWDK